MTPEEQSQMQSLWLSIAGDPNKALIDKVTEFGEKWADIKNKEIREAVLEYFNAKGITYKDSFTYLSIGKLKRGANITINHEGNQWILKEQL